MSLSTCLFPANDSHIEQFTKRRTNFDIFLSSVERPVNYETRISTIPCIKPLFSGNNSSTSSLSTRSRSTTSSTISSTPTSPILECTPSDLQFGSSSWSADTFEIPWDQQRNSQGLNQLRRERRPGPCPVSPTFSLGRASKILPSPQPEHQRCQNCYQFHKASSSSLQSSTCFFISAQSHRQSPSTTSQSHHAETVTLPIPSSPVRRRELCKSIWNNFEAMKAENDAIRKWISGSSPPHYPQKRPVSGSRPYPNVKQKISLRAEAPLIWLKWRAADGLKKGQTRSERNWEDIWQKILLKQDVSQSETDMLSNGTEHFGWITISFPSEHIRDLLKIVEEDYYS